jgi:hypothetical protein
VTKLDGNRIAKIEQDKMLSIIHICTFDWTRLDTMRFDGLCQDWTQQDPMGPDDTRQDPFTQESKMELTTKKLIPAISPDTLTIIGMMRELDTPEKTITKDDMRKAIGRDPSGLIHTALRHMLHDHGIVIKYVRDRGGWCRRDGADNLVDRKDGLTSMRRKARHESERLSVVDFAKLTDPQKVEACCVASLFGAVSHLATSNGIKRIEAAVTKADAAGLPIGKTLALFHDNA